MTVVSVLLIGFLTGIGLIVAIGPQNALVLRQGVRREHVAVVLAVCTLSDIILIGVGTAGIGVVFEKAPWIVQVMRWGGVAYLLWFAFTSLRSAFGPATSMQLSTAGGAAPPVRSAWAVAGATAALTWLNPHVYLDTVVMLGTVANQQALPWVFAVGAMLGSLVWFAALGYGAHLLAPVLRSPRAWRAIDAGIAVVMLLVAAKLAFAF